jgi:hypothetical protein
VEGWQNSHFTAVYDDGTVDTHPLFETEYGRAFGRALFLRPCCHRCPYGLNAPCVGICYKNLKKEREKNATCDRGKTVGSDGSV